MKVVEEGVGVVGEVGLNEKNGERQTSWDPF